jgi:rhodanese-related sulfurtransferase
MILPHALKKPHKERATMKKSVPFVLAALLLLIFDASLVPAAQNKFPGLEQQRSLFKTVTPDEAKSLIESRKDLLLVDVRGQDELREGYITGSVLMPVWDIVKGVQRPPRNKPILLICAVGGRSLALGKLMAKNGWNEVYNLKGGIEAWKEAKLPLQY